MNRLTEKLKDGLSNTYNTKKPTTNIANLGEVVQKLGQLEDLEEELGCDLLTWYRLLMSNIKTIYVIDDDDEIVKKEIDDSEYHGFFVGGDYCFMDEDGSEYYPRNFNKIWFLTKEEAEKYLGVKENEISKIN